jgi:DNA-directed RNA polymerase specialized sigma24 family protein
MSLEGSVTTHLGKLKKGDQAAARPLWERYFPWLVGLARRKLQSKPSGAADAEDVALGAFAKFCQSAEQGRLPEVRNRNELWRLLVTLTVRMAIDEVRRECRQKRGGTARAAEYDMPGAMLASESPAELAASRESPPDFAAQVAEECERLLGGLDDDDLKAIVVWKTEGCTNEEIAVRLGVVLRTVERKLRVIRQQWADGAPPEERDHRRASQ